MSVITVMKHVVTTELSLILLKPQSDITNMVIHNPLDHLLIRRVELTGAQTSTVSPVCSDL